MSCLERLNPIVAAIYFLSVTGVTVFSTDPVMLALSLCGAMGYYFVRNGAKNARSHLFFLLLFFITALINPIVSHNGKTVLLVINDSPITFEACVYGIVMASAVIATLYWFRSFTEIMTSDKLLYLFGKLSPKLSLILSMALRYVALLAEQSKKIKMMQTALGLYSDGNIVDRIRGGLRVFSVLVMWALENGITTADSMSARGYGAKRRTHFSLFSFGKQDSIILILSLGLMGVAVTCMAFGAADFEFYPTLSSLDGDPLSFTCYIAYSLLVFMPTIAQTEEKIRWTYLRSKI